MTRPVYCTRENVKQATDSAETARNNARVDRAIAAGARTIDGRMHRTFWPQTETRTFDWPPTQRSRSWVLWLGKDELISVSALSSGGTTIPAANYFLRPDTGPPFNRIEIDLDSVSAWSSGNTHQRAVSITGVFGYDDDDETTAGTLAEALDATEAGVDVSDSAAIGVGSLLRVGSERMIVTGKSMLDTGQNLQTSLTASAANDTVAVTDGSAFIADEIILIDSERMLIVDIASNNLVVKRAWDGSTLAAHTAPTADIYAPRTLTVERGAVGTTAATHSTSATVYRWNPPGPVHSLNIALAVNELQQQAAGYARTSGTGDRAKDTTGTGLADAWKNADPYRRKARGGAV